MRPLAPLLLVLSAGCTFNEHLPQVDIQGTVVVPREAATVQVYNAATDTTSEIGPVFGEGDPGNTYPYGGGTVGRFDYACYQSLVCKVVTGRFESYDDILDYFANVAQQPVVDEQGSEVSSAAAFQAACFELFNYTADFELAFLALDGPDFVENTDGDFEASFDMWQVNHYQNMQIWGWVDTPDEQFNFSTCNESRGQENQEYANDYRYGANVVDVLNFPGENISAGDWVASEGFTITTEDADAFRENPVEPRIVLDYLVE
jgi:hypothetical protein